MKRLAHLVWLLAGIVVLLAGWILVNAIDEDLTPEARAVVAAGEPTTGPLTEDNGYVWMTSLATPSGQDPLAFAREQLQLVGAGQKPTADTGTLRLPPQTSCKPDEGMCLPVAPSNIAALEEALTAAAEREALAEKMRRAPTFVEILAPATLHAPLPDLRGVLYAQELAFARARLASGRGDWNAAVSILEADMAFNRTALKSVRSVVSKMVTSRAVGRSSLFAVQLWRVHGAELQEQQPRLVAMLADLPVEALRMAPSLDLELATLVRDMHVYGKESIVRMAGAMEVEADLGDDFQRLFFQPNATANLIVARAAAKRPAFDGETMKFDAARRSIMLRTHEEDKPWYHYVALRNPVGTFLADAAATDYTTYQAALHDLQAVLALTRARISLPPSVAPDDWALLSSNPAAVDPYTGKQLSVDLALGQPSIAARRTPGWPKSMLEVTEGKLVGDFAYK